MFQSHDTIKIRMKNQYLTKSLVFLDFLLAKLLNIFCLFLQNSCIVNLKVALLRNE